MNEERNIKCNRCKCYRYPSDFLKEGREMKTCIKCRESAAKWRIENRCPHGKRKEYCVKCKGSQICEHKKPLGLSFLLRLS